jgi:hypothetical protein
MVYLMFYVVFYKIFKKVNIIWKKLYILFYY